MLLFTAKTRGILDAAIQQLPDENQHRLWREWINRNPQLRRPGGITEDHEPPLPSDILSVMLTALKLLWFSKQERLNAPNISEDEVSDLENDLTYIDALSRDLQHLPTA